ncbi:MAG: tripartite tricarboxylate transporter substrate binding protein [Burkholderiales bacterium]|nr:tripartite tricarboxylate transporter substrate binding protein [Burkholderiales bacterium]
MQTRWLSIVPLLWALAAGTVHAQEAYPTKPVRLILPYPPGGSTDFVAREVAAHMSQAFGQQVIVDSRPGAGTLIGLGIGAKSNPDGYTIVFGTSAGLAVNPALGVKMPYDPEKDFAPIGMMVTVPYVLVAHAAFPANNIRELLDLAKAQPGKINMASPGVGTPNHLGGELLNVMAGVRIVHVPYKGGAAAITDLAGGQVQIMFSGIPQAAAMLQAKRIKIIAAATSTRSRLLPEAAPIAETLPGFNCGTWYGLLAPAGTSAAIINRVGAEMMKALQTPDMVQRLAAQGVEAAPSGPDVLRKTIVSEYARWREVIKRAGITAEAAR